MTSRTTATTTTTLTLTLSKRGFHVRHESKRKQWVSPPLSLLTLTLFLIATMSTTCSAFAFAFAPRSSCAALSSSTTTTTTFRRGCVGAAHVPPCSAVPVAAPKNYEYSRMLVSYMSASEPDEESAAAAASSSSSENEPPKPAVKCPNCDLCDGSGRILGGIGVVLPWWPIKAYRPCPNFIKGGGTYVRSGQPLDEIAFGRDSTFNKDS